MGADWQAVWFPCPLYPSLRSTCSCLSFQGSMNQCILGRWTLALRLCTGLSLSRKLSLSQLAGSAGMSPGALLPSSRSQNELSIPSHWQKVTWDSKSAFKGIWLQDGLGPHLDQSTMESIALQPQKLKHKVKVQAGYSLLPNTRVTNLLTSKRISNTPHRPHHPRQTYTLQASASQTDLQTYTSQNSSNCLSRRRCYHSAQQSAEGVNHRCWFSFTLCAHHGAHRVEGLPKAKGKGANKSHVASALPPFKGTETSGYTSSDVSFTQKTKTKSHFKSIIHQLAWKCHREAKPAGLQFH